MKADFVTIRDRKRLVLRNDLAEAASVLFPPTSDEQVYLDASALTICKKIQSFEWSALDVVSAFARQALKENERLNFITECFLVGALQQARELDAHHARTKETVGPLHGLPVSVKDLFDVEGVDTSVGISSRCAKPAEKDAVIVSILKDAGAIILFKTNVPQTLNTNECGNPIFGTTTNPTNVAYTCGGSSGGEAASIMSQSSALGIGSDIAGSLRYPVAFCGGYSLKPSEGRWPRMGSFDLDSTFESPCINAVTGPMTRTFEDLRFISRVVAAYEPWTRDATCLNLPWTPPRPHAKKEGGPKYHFAYYVDNTYTKASPACSRAVHMTIEALRSAGHTCTPITPPSIAQMAPCFVALTSLDANASMRELIRRDPWESNVTLSMYFGRFPLWFRQLAALLFRAVYKDPQFPALFGVIGSKSTRELCEYNMQRKHFKQVWLETVWAHGYDGIICPVYPVPAVKHNGTTQILPIAVTTYIFNLLDYTVGTLPVTHVTREDDHRGRAEYAGWQGVFHNMLYNGMFGAPPIYNAEEMSGLNIAVQVVGKQFEEEKVVDMMGVIDGLLRGAEQKKKN